MVLSLSETVAGEVRAEMGRSRVSASELARRLGRSHSYVWRRITGDVPFDIAELSAIAEALGVPVSRLMPAERVA